MIQPPKKICFVLILFVMSGCVLSTEPVPSPGTKGVQAQAIMAYDRGIYYMGDGRYLLAREQFSEAATMAVTTGLYNDAMAGMAKADAILQNRRQYNE